MLITNTLRGPPKKIQFYNYKKDLYGKHRGRYSPYRSFLQSVSLTEHAPKFDQMKGIVRINLLSEHKSHDLLLLGLR